MTRGEDVERDVADKVAAALPAPYAVYPNVRWTGPTRPGAPATDGEADLVIAHPDHGILVVEVKDGDPSRSGNRWFLGPVPLERSPFDQAERNKYDLVKKLAALPDWRSGQRPPMGHAVAFPKVDLASLPRGHALLGPDVHREIVLDATALETPAAIRIWVEGAYGFWRGADADRSSGLGVDGMALVDRFLAPRYALRRLTRGRIEDDRAELLEATRAQFRVLTQQRRSRRLEIVGPAGSGKSMLAVEKARSLAAEGYRTLLVCFNQPLATALGRELADVPAPGGLTVATFHRLCELVAGAAGGLTARPNPVVPEWFDRTLPDALGAAIDALPEERYHAVVVDEGQDFELDWLVLLQALLRDPDEDVFWVFHDPGQALLRNDVVGQLGLPAIELFENLRNPARIARLANRFYRGGEAIAELRDDDGDGDAAGRVVVVEATDDRAVVDAVRVQLHRLIVDEEVRAWDIVVLTGRSAARSAVWKASRFGNVVLENPALNDDGSSRGLAPEDVPDEPGDGGVVLFDTIRRFKGLERSVVVLCELSTEGERLDELLYTGMTRPTTELVLIAPGEILARTGGDRG